MKIGDVVFVRWQGLDHYGKVAGFDGDWVLVDIDGGPQVRRARHEVGTT